MSTDPNHRSNVSPFSVRLLGHYVNDMKNYSSFHPDSLVIRVELLQNSQHMQRNIIRQINIDLLTLNLFNQERKGWQLINNRYEELENSPATALNDYEYVICM